MQENIIFPKPRYPINECLVLLSISRKAFYERVRIDRYQLTRDGGRSYMTHRQLLDAAKGNQAAG